MEVLWQDRQDRQDVLVVLQEELYAVSSTLFNNNTIKYFDFHTFTANIKTRFFQQKKYGKKKKENRT